MKVPITKTRLLWRGALRELSAQGPLDPDAIVWLWSLADRVYHAPGRDLVFARAPVYAPAWLPAKESICLFPVTLQAVEWLSAISKWWPAGDLLPTAYACVLSDGADHDIFRRTDRIAVETAISQWSSTLRVSVPDLQLAVRECISIPDTIETRPAAAGAASERESIASSATDWGELLALLSGAFHVPPWELLLRPWADIEQLLDAYPRVRATHSAVATDPDRRQALREFQEAVLFLKRRPRP